MSTVRTSADYLGQQTPGPPAGCPTVTAPIDDGDETTTRAALIANMRPWLLRFFGCRTINEAEAEDLAQETIVRALMNPAWSRSEQAAGYVCSVAANLFNDQLRKDIVRSTLSREDFEHIEEITPERTLLAQESLRLMLQVLERLSERTREIFLRHRIERMKQADIAASLGVCASTVEKHISTAARLLDCVHVKRDQARAPAQSASISNR